MCNSIAVQTIIEVLVKRLETAAQIYERTMQNI